MKKKLLILMMVMATAITTLLVLPSKSASAYTVQTDQNDVWTSKIEGPDIEIGVTGTFGVGSGNYNISATFEFENSYLYMNDFLVDITIQEGDWGPSKSINYRCSERKYVGYRWMIDEESQLCFTLECDAGEIIPTFCEENDYFAPFEYCDFFETVDLSYEGNLEYSISTYINWYNLREHLTGVEEIYVPDEAIDSTESGILFYYDYKEQLQSIGLEFDYYLYIDNEYIDAIHINAIYSLGDSVALDNMTIDATINGEVETYNVEPRDFYPLYEYHSVEHLESMVFKPTFDFSNNGLAFSFGGESDELLTEEDFLAPNNLDLDGKVIRIGMPYAPEVNLNKLDSDYAQECITMFEEDFGGLTLSSEINEGYIQRVNDVMNSFTTKEDLRNKLDFVSNSNVDVIFYDKGYDHGYNNGTSADVKDAIDKYIEDNNYHTNDEYLEYGRDQYLDGFNDGANGGDNIFDDLEDPVEEDDSSFFEELFTKDNLIYLICLVALCSFVASLFGRRR